mmetsp:Transcript_2159/g.7884  ORF Transcript_2159/g.7884 Transcript_2159/m.7884 type:complete len:83 (-) Transcript_2159:1266-1514(-)
MVIIITKRSWERLSPLPWPVTTTTTLLQHFFHTTALIHLSCHLFIFVFYCNASLTAQFFFDNHTACSSLLIVFLNALHTPSK